MRRLLLIITAALLLAGCQGQITPPPTSDPGLNPTRTVEEAATPPEQQPQPTSTSSPTETAVPSPTPPPPTPSPTEAEHAGQPLNPLPANQDITLAEIHMVTRQQGWGIGSRADGDQRILSTSDGGKTWQDVSPPIIKPEQAQTLRAWGYFADSQTAWVIYADQGPPPIELDQVWMTNSGGEEWEPSRPLPLTGDEPYLDPVGFTFIDQRTGWLLAHVDAGAGRDYVDLFQTQNGGKSWERLDDPYQGDLSGSTNTGIAFGSPDWGWVTKDNPQVIPGSAFLMQSQDGGESWNQLFLPPPQGLDWENNLYKCKTFQPTFTSPQVGQMLVECLIPEDSGDGEPQIRTFIYATSDRGDNWQHTELPTPVFDLEFIDLQTGYAAGQDIYRTTDGGATWTRVKSVNWQGDFSYVSQEDGWAVARRGEESALVLTTNGGATWQLLEPQTSP